MNDLMKVLVKVANTCDQKGLHTEASELDEIITKLADDVLTPHGKPFKGTDGRMMQRFLNQKGVLTVKPAPTEELGWGDWVKQKMFGQGETAEVEQTTGDTGFWDNVETTKPLTDEQKENLGPKGFNSIMNALNQNKADDMTKPTAQTIRPSGFLGMRGKAAVYEYDVPGEEKNL